MNDKAQIAWLCIECGLYALDEPLPFAEHTPLDVVPVFASDLVLCPDVPGHATIYPATVQNRILNFALMTEHINLIRRLVPEAVNRMDELRRADPGCQRFLQVRRAAKARLWRTRVRHESMGKAKPRGDKKANRKPPGSLRRMQ